MRAAIHNLPRALGLAIILFSIGRSGFAQELQCNVRIDISAISQSDQVQYVEELKPKIQEYLNGRAWTKDRYRREERIRCELEITILSASTEGFNSFRAQLSVGVQRPIYGTIQTTVVTQIADGDWVFGFEPNQSLIHDMDRFDGLTSVLDFYAFLLLGYDYDSFGPLAGTPHFEQARKIANLAPASGAGWTVGSERTRGTLIQQLLDPRLERVRLASFDYHYGCLDHFVTDPQSARDACLGALHKLQDVLSEVSNQYVVDLFLATKNQELVGVFDDSNQSSDAYGILLNIDPSRSSIYDRLVQ
ncbi:MAG TPA: DUF4835 family protein [Rhodothermales bacterium]